MKFGDCKRVFLAIAGVLAAVTMAACTSSNVLFNQLGTSSSSVSTRASISDAGSSSGSVSDGSMEFGGKVRDYLENVSLKDDKTVKVTEVQLYVQPDVSTDTVLYDADIEMTLDAGAERHIDKTAIESRTTEIMTSVFSEFPDLNGEIYVFWTVYPKMEGSALVYTRDADGKAKLVSSNWSKVPFDPSDSAESHPVSGEVGLLDDYRGDALPSIARAIEMNKVLRFIHGMG